MRIATLPIPTGKLARSGRRSGEHQMGLRLRARYRRSKLELALADGADPSASAELALRAEQLTQRTTRGRLACWLRRIVADAEATPPPGLTAAVPLQRASVIRRREQLLGIAELLDRDAPINAGGVARLLALMTDVSSPLYNPDPGRDLGEVVWWIADGLQPSPE